MRHRIHFKHLAIALLALATALQSGCSRSSANLDVDDATAADASKVAALKSAPTSESTAKFAPQPSAEPAGYTFAPPVRIKAGDEFVSVESPGYACPTMADVDGDGKEDLVVGQFNSGKMQFCKNVASEGELPKFAAADWIMTGGDPAVVPGVW